MGWSFLVGIEAATDELVQEWKNIGPLCICEDTTKPVDDVGEHIAGTKCVGIGIWTSYEFDEELCKLLHHGHDSEQINFEHGLDFRHVDVCCRTVVCSSPGIEGKF